MTQANLQISSALRNRILGKALLVVLLSSLIGFWLAAALAADRAKGMSLTLEQYTADFETYRAGLLSAESFGSWGWIMIIFLLLGGTILLYELIGHAFAWMVGRVWQETEAVRD